MRGVPPFFLAVSFSEPGPFLDWGRKGGGERGGVQFDSDYSGGEGASPFYFLQVSGFFVVVVGGIGVMEVGWDTANLCG